MQCNVNNISRFVLAFIPCHVSSQSCGDCPLLSSIVILINVVVAVNGNTISTTTTIIIAVGPTIFAICML